MFGTTTRVRDVPTTDKYIYDIIDRVQTCAKHPHGALEPCYILPISITKDVTRKENWGVCNWRARQAGYIGNTSEAPRR